VANLIGVDPKSRRKRLTEHGVQWESRGPCNPAAKLYQALRERNLCHYGLYPLERSVTDFLKPDYNAQPRVTGERGHDRRPDPDLFRETFWH